MRTIIIAAALLLTACAGAVPGNPQGYAGITKVNVEFEVVDGNPVLSRASWTDGKDKQDISLKVDLSKGVLTYKAGGVKGVDAIALRAAVEQAVSADAKAAMPGIVDSVVKAAVQVLVPGL